VDVHSRFELLLHTVTHLKDLGSGAQQLHVLKQRGKLHSEELAVWIGMTHDQMLIRAIT
jgi:hypothetical protein